MHTETGDNDQLATGDEIQDAVPETETAAPSSGMDTDQGTDNGPASLAEAIAAAVTDPKANADEGEEGEAGDKPSAAEPEAKPEDDKGAAEPEGDKSEPDENGKADDDPSDAELKGYAPKAAKRITKLLSQRNQARRDAEEFRGDASSYREIRTFMAEHKLVDQEVQSLFAVGADLKSNDPVKLERVLQVLLPLTKSVMQQLGKELPDDLRADVESGSISEDRARELAQARGREILAQARAQEADQVVTRQRTEQANAALAGQIKTSVAEWEASVRQTDPDFTAKSRLMRQTALAVVAERGRPQTPAQAVEMAKEAYQRANELAQSLRPASRPTRPTPEGGFGGNRAPMRTEPKSLEEAMRLALGR